MEQKVKNVADLKHDKRNPRLHNERNLKVIVNSLHDVGFARSIVIDENNEILAGNGVTEAAVIAGIEKVIEVEADGNTIVAVRRRGLSDEQKQRLKYYDNRSGELAGWDNEQLLADLNEGLDLSAFWNQDELDALLEGMNDVDGGAGTDTEPQTDKADELRQKWGVDLGQMWALGEHRIICGDCTDPAVVARVMGGEKADLFLTDPPYGVAYADKNKWLNAVAFGNRIQTPIENDHGNIADIAKNLWLPCFSLALECCCDTSSFYIFMPQGGDQMMMMMMMMNEAGWMPRHELIWLKNNHVLGRADYNYKHEPILYGWKRKGTHHFYGDFQTSVIECKKPQSSDLHPTMKPVELVERLIPNNTKVGEIVYEPFSGSGTTIIACQNLNRKCRAAELSPGYVAVAIERFYQHTGIDPVLID